MSPTRPLKGRLDHGLYEHREASRVEGRPWPGGQAAAAFALIHLEVFEIDPPADAVREPRLRGDFGSYFPDLRAHSYMEYGTRIGVFRLLDLLQPMGWSVAAAVNGLVARDRPQVVRDLAGRGVEILASGWSASRMVTSTMPPEQEERLLAQSTDAIAQATGRKPRGYASQDYGYSMRTPAFLETAGFTHAVDWPNDERAFRFGPSRELVMLPAAAELDDAQAMIARKLQPREWGAMLATALARWRRQPLVGAVLALPLHAWVAGAAHRAPALRRALQTLPAASFWQAVPSEVAAIVSAIDSNADQPDQRSSR